MPVIAARRWRSPRRRPPPPPPSCLLPPVDAPVVDPFRAAAVPVVPGQPRPRRTPSAPGTPVRAAAAGTVTFSGVVAGTRYVVVDHADGLRATYGGLASTACGG